MEWLVATALLLWFTLAVDSLFAEIERWRER